MGHLNRQPIARLVGVAPTNRHSSTLRSQRTTGEGRVAVRDALFMPTIVVAQHNPLLHEFYRQLLQRGKTKMVALVAAMRKPLVIPTPSPELNNPGESSPKTLDLQDNRLRGHQLAFDS